MTKTDQTTRDIELHAARLANGIAGIMLSDAMTEASALRKALADIVREADLTGAEVLASHPAFSGALKRARDMLDNLPF